MNALQQIWKDLNHWLRHKRVFAVDAEAYETLRLLAKREQRTPQEVAAQLFMQASQEQTSQDWALRCWEQLSPRQKQIAAYVCRGDSSRQIAAQLCISQTTVKSHVEIVLRKFEVNSRVELRRMLEPWDISGYL